MDSSFNQVAEELEDLEQAVTGQIEYIVSELLTDGTGSAKPLSKEEVEEVIRELQVIQ